MEVLTLSAIVCNSISMGAEPVVLKSDWSGAGPHTDLLVFELCIFQYKDRLPSSCSFTDSNALRKTLDEHTENNIL